MQLWKFREIDVRDRSGLSAGRCIGLSLRSTGRQQNAEQCPVAKNHILR